MSSVPHRFQEGTDYNSARPLLDDNFNKVVNDVADLGARQTTTTSYNTGSISAGGSFRHTIAICNPGDTSSFNYVNTPDYVSGISSIVPSIDVFIDTDNNLDYLYPVGISLSSSAKALAIDAKLDLTPADTGAVATVTISGRNYDTSSHTYYIHVRFSYFPSQPSGAFR
jgi:hypothetical protein